MFVPVWTSRQVRTADCYLIVTARRRLSRNRFLSSSVCMSDLALRRQNKRIDQSEASYKQAQQPIRSVGRTIASTNQKRRANKRIDQSEVSCEQAQRPIRSVGRTSASTNQKIFTKQRRSREGAAQPIRFFLAGSIGGRLVTPEGRIFFGLILFLQILHQLRTTDQPIRSLHRSNSDRLSSDGLSSG